MRRFSSFIFMITLLFSQFQIGTLYANNVQEISAEQQKHIASLDTVEQVIDTTISKISAKTKDKEIQERLQEKKQEVESYIDTVQQDIQEEKNTKEIQQKVQEAKKVVVLKVISGATQYENIEENISSEIAPTQEQKLQAKETLQKSLKVEEDYSLIVKSTLSLKDIQKLFHTFDTNISLLDLYSTGKYRYVEVTIPSESIFREEMMEDIESGILPEKYLWIEIVQPEVFAIGSLQGENIPLTWGVESYQTYNYFSDIEANNTDIRVGVIDTGIDYQHPDLQRNVIQGYDFVNNDTDPMDDQWHGTHVAGTIGANINGQGIIGVNPYTKLVPLKICNAQWFCPSYAVIRALDYATQQGIEIVNMSLGGKSNPEGHAICEAISAYTNAGGIVIAAAGNSNIDVQQFVPGGCTGVISVAALDKDGKKAPFSNYGNTVDISAPGVNIYSTSLHNSYTQLSGTSMAAPHVTGIVSFLKMYDTSLSSQDIENILKTSSSSTVVSSHLPLWNTIDMGTVMNQLWQKYKEQEVWEEEEVVSQDNENTPSEWVSEDNVSHKDTHLDDTQEWVLKDPFTPVVSQIIDFGTIKEIIETNSDSSGIEVVDIDEQQENTKPHIDSQDVRIYNENGELLEDTVEINNQEELFELQPNTGEFNTGEEIESVSEEENILSPEEIFIGNAQEIVRINSQEEGEEMDIQEDIVLWTGSWTEIQDTTVEKIIYSPTPYVYADNLEGEIELLPIDEQGYIIGPVLGSVEISEEENQQEKENIILETSDISETKEELLVDGAEKSLQINSSDTNWPVVEINTVPYTSKISEDIIYWESIVEEYIPEDIGEPVELLDFNELYEPIFGGEIPIPDGFIDEPDDLWEDEVYNGAIEQDVEIESYWDLWIQNTYTCNIKIWQNCNFSIYKSYRYAFNIDTPWIVNHTSSKRTLTITGASPGTTKYELIQYGHLYYTIYITVTADIPVYSPINVTVEKWKYVNVDISKTTSSRFIQSNTTGSALLYQWGKILGNSIWKSKYYVLDHDGTTILYEINIDIVPTPPTILDIEMYKWQTYRQPVSYAHTSYFTYTVSSSDIWVNPYGYNTLEIRWTHIGEYQITGYFQWQHTYTLNVSVKEIPVPQEYSIQVEEWKTFNVYFPEEWKNYSYSVASWNTWYAYLYNYNGYVMIQAQNIGTFDFYVKDAYGYTQYIIHTQILPKPLEVRDITLIQWQTVVSYIDKARNYIYSSSDSTKVNLSYTSSKVYIYGKAVGKTQIILSQSGYQKYILNIDVQSPPPPQVFDIQVPELETTQIYLPTNQYLTYTTSKQWIADATYAYNQSSWIITIQWKVEGNMSYELKDSTNVIKYIIRVTITPVPPIPTYISLYETKTKNIGTIGYSDTFSFSESDMISLSRNGAYIDVHWLKPGTVELYVRQWWKRHYKTFIITIIPKPPVTVYPVDLYNGQWLNVYLPEAISNYAISYTWVQNLLSEKVQYTSHFYVETQRTWNYNIHLKDNMWFDIYRIEINSKPYERTFELFQTESIDPGLSSSHTHRTDNSQIAYVHNGDEIYGANPGTTAIHTYTRRGIHTSTTYVTVLPIPDPIEISCVMYKGEVCRLEYYHGGRGIRFTTDNPSYIKLEYGKQTTRVSAKATGKARVEIQAYRGKYIKYIMNVTVLPTPPQKFTCTFPQGLDCQTLWYDDAWKYAITTNNPAVVDVRLERYTQTFATGPRTMERTKILGRSEGTAEVYLYENGDHKATIFVTVTPPIPPIVVEDGSITLKQWESITVQILNGGGEYRILTDTNDYDANIADFRTRNNSENPNTWELTIIWKTPGITYPTFRDQYSQTYQMSVRVLDTTLDINTSTLNFSDYTPAYIITRNYHTDVTYSKSNTNVRVNKELQYFSDGTLNTDMTWFLVTPLESWTTTLTFTDSEGNRKEVEVVVWNGADTGWSWGNWETQVGIRYIRDWIKGSNKNRWSHWGEIQALERNTGKNIAFWKTVTSLVANQPWYEYTKIVDGNTSGGNYAECTRGKTNDYVIVDLWAVYDISTVKVWHYYVDSRTYYGSKTEVSADGENWIVLFDSALEGTYMETSRGRSYDIDMEKLQVKIELDKILEEIFGELGVQSSEELQINSYSISDNTKERLDRAIKNIVSEKWENYAIQFLQYLNQNKTNIAQKYQNKYTTYSLEDIVYTLDMISLYFEKNLDFQIIHSSQDISNGAIGGIEFQVSSNLQGKIGGIGVQFTNANGQTERQPLDIQSDGKYIVAFSQDSCAGCTDLQPYYLLSWRTDVIIASVDEEQVEIANSSYIQFVNILRSIWNWRGYTKQDSIKAIVDIKQDYDDYVSLAVSLFPWVWEVYDVWTLLLWKDPITGEQLSDFNKVLTFVWLISGAWSWTAARKLWTEAIEKLAKELWMSMDEMTEIATEVASEYKIDSIEDIVELKDKLTLDRFKGLVREKAKDHLISIVQKSHKISPDLVTHIRKWRDGMIFWLEKGNNFWYDHIFKELRAGGLTRFEEMKKWWTFLTEDEMIDGIFDIIRTWTKTVWTDVKKWSFTKNIKWRDVVVGTWDNGFIVTITYK